MVAAEMRQGLSGKTAALAVARRSGTARRPRPRHGAPPLPALLGVFIACAWLSACASDAGPPGTQTVVLNGKTFHLELALTGDQRHQGLSDRKEIAADGGMLFVFPVPVSGSNGFVMRRCLAPLDILFIGPTGDIITTHAMQMEPYDRRDEQLHSYTSDWPYQFAIELRGGTLGELGLKKGQKIDLPVDGLKARAR
jgi:uncharacterized protein